MLAMVADLLNIEARTAADPSEALAALDAAPCDVALVDVRLAGSDGLALAAAVRRAHPEVRVIVMSGAGDDPAMRRAANSVGAEYLHKPFPPQALKGLLDGAGER